MPYLRFTKVIIHYFLSKRKSIPKRHNSFINTIKDDDVLGKLKYVSKGEDTQLYGMSIPDVMMNDDIKNSDAYLTYLALSTSTKPPKKTRGKGKGLMSKKETITPSKKGYISAEDNIIPNPNVALKLGVSISLTKTEEQDEQKIVHETHERLVTEKTSNDEKEGRVIRRRSSGVVIRDTPKKVTKASRRAYKIQQQSTGSSEGAGITLEVPDEPKGSSAAHDKSDEEEEHIDNDEEKHNDDEVPDEEEIDDERTESKKDKQEMSDAEKIDAEKAEEEKDDEEQTKDDQAGKDDQADDDEVGALIYVTHKEKPELPVSTSILSLSSDYGNQFLNISSDVSLHRIIKETADTEINSMLDVPVQQEIPTIQQTLLLDVLVSVIPTMSTPTPSTTPPTTEVQATTVNATDPSPTILLRLSELERKVEALSKVNHSEVIKESVQANTRRSNYKRGFNLNKVLKQKRCDDEDQDHSSHSTKEKKKKSKKDGELSKKSSTSKESSKGKTPPKASKSNKSVHVEEIVEEPAKEVAMDIDKSTWFTQPPRLETPNPEWSKDPNANVGPEQTWFNDLEKAAKDPTKFDDLMGSTIDFSNFIKHRLKKDKITKAGLEGSVFKLLKCTCKSSIELEYHLEKRYLAFSNQMDCTNPEGHLTIPVNFFFNNDLEYLKTRNKERKYTTSITKTKAIRYELEGIEYMIPKLWSPVKVAYDKDDILSVIRVTVDKQFGYGYLKEIVNKLFNQPSNDIVDLVNELRMFTRSVVINKRVKDVQLGVESYQKKLNVTKPQKEFSGISFKEPYTTTYDLKGVVYLNKRK
ncbi:hypothetical protein Tco_1226664 [Tanacetum coccineum]